MPPTLVQPSFYRVTSLVSFRSVRRRVEIYDDLFLFSIGHTVYDGLFIFTYECIGRPHAIVW